MEFFEKCFNFIKIDIIELQIIILNLINLRLLI